MRRGFLLALGLAAAVTMSASMASAAAVQERGFEHVEMRVGELTASVDPGLAVEQLDIAVRRIGPLRVEERSIPTIVERSVAGMSAIVVAIAATMSIGSWQAMRQHKRETGAWVERSLPEPASIAPS